MTCKELVTLLDRYVAGELGPDLKAASDEHLSQCDDCRRYLRSYRGVIAVAEGAKHHPEGGSPDSVPEGLVRAVLAAKGRIRR